MAYVEEDKSKKTYAVKPGIWAIQATAAGFRLSPTSFVQDQILDSFISTKNITDKIDCFFRRLHVYKKRGIEVPKRAALLYGPPGCGKTSTIKKISDTYVADNETAVIIWPTDKFESYEIKNFIQSFSYKKVKKLILIVEDIGGVEIDKARMKSDSSLLSLLDNQEKTFTIPIFILATTNFPEIFLGNLTNRPGRFDDKIECNYPDGTARVELLKFFFAAELPENVVDLVSSKSCAEFSPAHLKEAVIRSDIYEIPLYDSVKLISKEIEEYKKAFTKTGKIGIGYDD